MRPILRNRFIKKLTLDRVVPTISARVPWLTFRMAGSWLGLRPKAREQQKSSCQPLLAGIEELIEEVFFNSEQREKAGAR